MHQESPQWQWVISSKTFPWVHTAQPLDPKEPGTESWKYGHYPRNANRNGAGLEIQIADRKTEQKRRGIFYILKETVHTGGAAHQTRGAKPSELCWWSRTSTAGRGPGTASQSLTDQKIESKIKENKRSKIKIQMMWAPPSPSSF